jgi:hypothetical protein
MRNAGFVVLVGAVAVSGLLLALWLIGLVSGVVMGGFIHILLALALLIAVIGVGCGIALVLLGGRSRAR